MADLRGNVDGARLQGLGSKTELCSGNDEFQDPSLVMGETLFMEECEGLEQAYCERGCRRIKIMQRES